jgi:hypothetical protein
LRDQEDWGKTLKAIFWPRHHRGDVKFTVRLGRVIHWILTGLAAMLMIAGPAAMIRDRRDAEESKQAHAIWVQDNPPPKIQPSGNLQYKLKLVNGDSVTVEGDAESTRYDAVARLRNQGFNVDDSYEPTVYDNDSGLGWSLLIGSLFVFFVGRMMRYLMAGE